MRDTSLDAPSTTQSSARIAVGLRSFPGIRPLAADYSDNFGAVSSFFGGNPWETDGWAQAIARAQVRGAKRAELATIIEAQQKHRGAPPDAVANARRLAEPASVAIVTGQQAGLFGGPLYTLLKAIAALRVAARVERDFGVPAVPVFWVESEDHDWDEVRTCTVADETLTPVAVALPPRAGDAPARVADLLFDQSIVTALETLDRALPSTEFRAELMDRLREIYAPGASPSVSFARLLEHVLGGRGLVVYDASDLQAKPLARDVFVHELSVPGDSARRAARAGDELASRGYHAQVQPGDETVCLYSLDRGKRTPIRRRSDHFLVGERSVPAAALADEAREHPERFSPNVLLRPIVQDALFPTAVYIPGPNELAYFAQLGGVYAHFGMVMPLLYPRPSATLVDSAALRFLTRYNLPFESLQRQDEAALNQLLASQMPEAVDKAYEEASRMVETAMARLIDAIPALDPTLEGATRSTLGKMQHDLQTLHGKMIQAAKRRDETLRRQYTRTRALAFPGGMPQERTIAFVYFLNQYGPALVDRLLELLPLEPGHWVMTV